MWPTPHYREDERRGGADDEGAAPTVNGKVKANGP
jgi:hypothetical protein